MSSIYFSENKSGPQYTKNGVYKALEAYSSENDQLTMFLDVRALGGGRVEALSVTSLEWLSPPSTLLPTYTFNINLNSVPVNTGEGRDAQFSFTVSTRTAQPELVGGVQGIFDINANKGDNAFINGGFDYRASEQFSFDNGQISGTITISRVTPAVLTVVGVNKTATDISAWPSSLAVVPSSEFISEGAGWYEGNSAQFQVDLSRYNTPTDPETGAPVATGVVVTASQLTTYGPAPIFYQANEVLSTTPRSGSGSGLTVKLRGTAQNGGLRAVKTQGTVFAMNPASSSNAFPGVKSVSVEGGSGTGGRIFVEWDYSINTYKLSSSIVVATPGQGYLVGDYVKVTATNMEGAGMPVLPGTQDELVEVTQTIEGSTLVTVVSGGSGYETGDKVTITNQELIEKNYISADSTTTMVVEVVVDDLSVPGANVSIGGGGISNGSIGSSGGNVGSKLDAREGSKTVRETRSVSSSARASAPDISKDPKTPTITDEVRIVLRNAYTEDPDGAGPYVLEESAPIAYLDENYAAQAAVYSQYLRRLILGDSYGVQVTEAMRDDIQDGWVPNRDFRYYDPYSDKLFAMKMDATTWSVTQDGAIMTTSGMWLGESDGTVSVGSNLEGNAEPLLDQSYSTDAGSPTRNAGGQLSTIAPPGGGSLVVDGETGVNSGDYFEIIEVNLTLATELDITGLPGYIPGGPGYASDAAVEGKSNETLLVYVTGKVVTAGDTLDTTPSGGIPVGYKGTIVTADAITLESDLFSAPLDPSVTTDYTPTPPPSTPPASDPTFADRVASADASYSVTVLDPTGYDGLTYHLNGVSQFTVNMLFGQSIYFDLSSPSLAGHPFAIYTDSSKTTQVVNGVEQAGSGLLFTPEAAGTYSYQCINHEDMGGSIVVT